MDSTSDIMKSVSKVIYGKIHQVSESRKVMGENILSWWCTCACTVLLFYLPECLEILSRAVIVHTVITESKNKLALHCFDTSRINSLVSRFC